MRALSVAGLVAVLPAFLACSVKALAQELEWQSSQTLGVPPAGADMFQLNDLEAFKKYSGVKIWEMVGPAYRRGPWITPAFAHVGMATNTMRVCDKKVAYLAGYNPIVDRRRERPRRHEAAVVHSRPSGHEGDLSARQ